MAESRRAPTPRQLPYAVPDFTGRAAERRDVAQALSGRDGTLMPVVAVTGMGGVGKTALAVRCAHDVAAAHPDGQLYADLAGAGDAPADSALVLVAFLRALGRPDERIPHDLEGRVALYRSLTAERRLLVVLDNARDAEQVLPLLPRSASCAVLLTSRAELDGAPVTHRVPLTALTPQDALGMLVRVSGRDAEQDAAALRRVAAACGHLPLAVRIAGAQLASRPGWDAERFAGLLREPSRRLEHLHAGEASLQAVFALAHDQLPTHAQESLGLLSLTVTGTVDHLAAAALLGLPEDAVHGTLRLLADAGLLERSAWRQYRIHDLVRLFARQRERAQPAAGARDAALRRLLDHYLAGTERAYPLILPGHSVPPLLSSAALAGPGPRHTGGPGGPVPAGPHLTDAEQALAWGTSIIGDALAVLRLTAASHLVRAACLLLRLDIFLENVHRWRDVLPVAEALVDAALSAGDGACEGRARYALGHALAEVGRMAEAEDQIDRAAALCERGGDRLTLAYAQNVRGYLTYAWQDARASRESLERAVRTADGLDEDSWALVAIIQGNLIQVRAGMGEVDEELLRTAERQVELNRAKGHTHNEAWALNRLGQVLCLLGEHDRALSAYRRVLDLLRGSEEHQAVARTHTGMAEAHLARGNLPEAGRHARTAVESCREHGHRRPLISALCVLGDVALRRGRPAEARAVWREAGDLAARTGVSDPQVEARLATAHPPR
ncbi:ATP-binding protein [Streptomyces sp. NPDC057794]|uniref:ATP-binding protein n=1 Tax=Streptomyces sp. NPDC057794 TaxID=3346251 RepID=UPI0036CA9751